MTLILSILLVFAILVVSELWWRYKRPHDELSRKFIHIMVGSFAAFWPFFLQQYQILLLSAAFIIVIIFSKYYNIFKAIHAVERPTWGEVCFALAVGLLAVITDQPLIYAVALLHMSLADALAALVGTAWGKNNSYKVFGHKKSVIGSLAFLLCSLIILIAYATVIPIPPSAAVIVVIALGATLLENIAVRGIDNLLVPILVAVTLMNI